MLDFEWVAVGLGDVTWIGIAFLLGFAARLVALPPLVGFLAAGFLLSAFGYAHTDFLQQLADIGITLLLFSVGLKLNLRTLARPQVWAVTALHTTMLVGLMGSLVYLLAWLGVTLFDQLDVRTAFLVAFALSFSSTVFVVKVLEEKGEMTALHGRIAVGILIMQDIAAVVFMVAASDKVPSIWAVLLLLLIPLRPLIGRLLYRVGHGELQVLYGFMLALGGAELFELVEMKGDLGALVLGVLVSNHAKAEELAKDMLGFKNLFLLGFFLSVGATGQLTLDTVLIGASLVPLVLLKSVGFFALLNLFKLRSRTSWLSTLSLSNFSEFGLIVASIGVANGWLSPQWLVVLSVALALSFVLAAALNADAHELFNRVRTPLERWQREERLPDDHTLDIGFAEVAVVGMGGIGMGAYDLLRETYGDGVVGIDIDPVTVRNHQADGRRVLLGDPTDVDFWERVQEAHTVQLVMLALPHVDTNLEVLRFLRQAGFAGRISVTAKFADEEAVLLDAGASSVFNIYREAGAGFAEHVTVR